MFFIVRLSFNVKLSAKVKGYEQFKIPHEQIQSGKTHKIEILTRDLIS